MEHDFRSVYASALKDWFGLPDPETTLGEAYPILPIFKAPSVGIDTVRYSRKDLPPGTYFYSIRVNGAFSSKKLLVI